jgi:Flp pilus assembly pilin Flp
MFIPRKCPPPRLIHPTQQSERRLLQSWIQPRIHRRLGCDIMNVLRRLWIENEGQDIAEYAVMLAVILVLVVGTIRLVGSNANNAFSSVASSLQ